MDLWWRLHAKFINVLRALRRRLLEALRRRLLEGVADESAAEAAKAPASAVHLHATEAASILGS